MVVIMLVPEIIDSPLQEDMSQALKQKDSYEKWMQYLTENDQGVPLAPNSLLPIRIIVEPSSMAIL